MKQTEELTKNRGGKKMLRVAGEKEKRKRKMQEIAAGLQITLGHFFIPTSPFSVTDRTFVTHFPCRNPSSPTDLTPSQRTKQWQVLSLLAGYQIKLC